MSTTGHLQYGPAKDFLDVMTRMSDVAESMEDAPDAPGVVVEFITTSPYANVVGVVTAVGGKDGDVLLTVEPQNQPSRSERVNLLAAAIRRVDGNHDLGAAALAEALLSEGVIPMRAF